MVWAQIEEFVASVSTDNVLRRFDVEFDVPLEQEYAVGLLRMQGAFAPVSAGDPVGVVRRVGAYWCDIVRADVDYDLITGLRLANESRDDAEWLHQQIQSGDQTSWPADFADLPGYAGARWLDAVGKIHYRLGSYARARMSFEAALRIAEKSAWWCALDIHSNLLRARFEEQKQAYTHVGEARSQGVSARAELAAAGRRQLIDSLEAAIAAAQGRRAKVIDPPAGIEMTIAEVRNREFIRGLSSLLHNLAVVRKENGDPAESMKASVESAAISAELGDKFRIGQSNMHQAFLDPVSAEAKFTAARQGKRSRNHVIAEQRLAVIHGGEAGLAEINALIDRLAAAGGGVGAEADVEIRSYSVGAKSEILNKFAAQLDAARLREEQEGLRRQTLAIGRSVRQVVVLPAYKRAYALAVRPSFLDNIASALAVPPEIVLDRHRAEEAFGLIEESSGRELLDLLATSSLPSPGEPSTPGFELTFAPEARPDEQPRRGGLRRTAEATDRRLLDALAARESEFEDQFLRQPLDAAPHDPDIAHRVRMFVANNDGTCIVRYFTYGLEKENDAPDRAKFYGAFVFRGPDMFCVDGLPYAKLVEFAAGLNTRRAPDRADCERIWELLVAPLWAAIDPVGGKDDTTLPGRLVMIPVDDIFRVPLHVAVQPGTSTPLGARLPMCYSVSATAFVSRSRHLLQRQFVEADDSLAAIVVARAGVSGSELVRTDWPSEQMVIAGDLPTGCDAATTWGADWDGIAKVGASNPEFFVYAGHGWYEPRFDQLGPVLALREDFLTQYDVALRLKLSRNKLTILGACLAGQAAGTASGDIGGFLRSFIAAGAGAIAMPLWEVYDHAIGRVGRRLLRRSRQAAYTETRVFDVAEQLFEFYRDELPDSSFDEMVEHMPLGLYL